MSSEHRALRVVIVGHVDHGKSTLVGRLLYETGSLPDGKFEQIQTVCRRRGMQFEWAFLMDALQAERDQNITIDVSQIWFKTRRRNYVIIDAPGHKEFLKNMVSGAASADAALLLIDAHEGIQEQSRRHAYLLSLLGIRQVVVVVNKMDLVNFDQAVFTRIEADYRDFLRQLNVQPLQFLPIAARDGVNMVTPDPRTSWYEGPTLIQMLDDLEQPVPPADLPLRFAVQDVYRFDHRRILAGRIESGTLRVGDTVVFAPSNKESVVASIEVWNAAQRSAVSAGESVGITLHEQIFVERGSVGNHIDQMPIETNRFRARVFWMGDRPLSLAKKYKIKLLTQEIECQLASIDQVIDASTLEASSAIRRTVEKNEVAEVTIQSRGPLVMDNYDRLQTSGRFVLVDGNDVAGGGVIFGGVYLVHKQVKSSNITWSESHIRYRDRVERNGHPGLVVWMTGLSGSGKSTLARALEKELFERQMQAYVLDGDNMRHGLNSNLSFSPEDRVENIRRVAEVAKLMADAGVITVTSFISPYRLDRVRAREIVASSGVEFVEVYVSAPLEVCEKRDPKNLYRKARAGEIKGFTGLDAPYEIPENPELVLETSEESAEACLEQLLEFLLPRLRVD
ncbi:MAG: adenylyl-sulfate kinase [Verrucomicrobia bacterium]|nr:adenylyl-sulfate kinase [Verrucomicrobiota bacterium]